ncbi:MAG: DUF6655 family protein [Isosphaeraceae bacterium]
MPERVPSSRTPCPVPRIRFHSPPLGWPCRLLAASVLVIVAGCGTVKTSGTPRTGTEQLLLTNAWDSALQKVDFRPLAGVPVFLDTTNVAAVDQGWVVSSLRQSLLAQGVLLREKREQAQWVVEARVGAYGTNESNWLLGISQTTIPATITGVPSGTIPEIPLIKKSDQQGVAKLALFAYDRSSGQLVWNSGTMVAIATAKDVHVLGVGPIQSGSIRGGAEFVGMKLPIPSEAPPSEPVVPDGNSRPRRGFTEPALRHSASYSDLDSFAP